MLSAPIVVVACLLLSCFCWFYHIFAGLTIAIAFGPYVTCLLLHLGVVYGFLGLMIGFYAIGCVVAILGVCSYCSRPGFMLVVAVVAALGVWSLFSKPCYILAGAAISCQKYLGVDDFEWYGSLGASASSRLAILILSSDKAL
ncbi:hypothetical protein U1Q18_019096 [Sarracenia purpurea var. burkii]